MNEGRENCRVDFYFPLLFVFFKRGIDISCFVQREDLGRVMDLFSVREHHARTLLIHYRWDVEKLIAVYVDKGKSCIFAAAGVTLAEFVDLDPEESTSTVMCEICMDDVLAKDVTLMDCGHCFCNNCKSLSLMRIMLQTSIGTCKN